MTLQELIEALALIPDGKVRYGFSAPHSYRGDYAELAFSPAEAVTVASMRANAQSAMGRAFDGYKGGVFVMQKSTRVWIAECDQGDGEAIGPALLAYWRSGVTET